MSTAAAAPPGTPEPGVAQGGIAKAARDWWTDVRSGQLGSLPIIIGALKMKLPVSVVTLRLVRNPSCSKSRGAYAASASIPIQLNTQ